MLLCLAVGTLLAGCAPEVAVGGSPGGPDTYYPNLGGSGYDAVRYDLRLDWDPLDNAVRATATLTLVPDVYLSEFYLDFSGPEIEDLRVNSQPAQHERKGGELLVRPAKPLDVGKEATVTVEYGGQPMRLESVAAPIDGGWFNFGTSAMAAGQPDGASAWYPVNEHPTDKAAYRVTISTSSDYTAIANGVLAGRTDNDDGTTTWVYESAYPQASSATSLVIGKFCESDGELTSSGVAVRHWFQCDQASESEAMMEPTVAMVEFFETLFGPYPFEVYGTVVVDEEIGFILETQTLTILGRDFVSGDGKYEHLLAHELAHQWFANFVSIGQWSDVWLNEGFASYSSYLWFEHIDPAFDIDSRVAADQAFFGEALRSPPGSPPSDDLFNGSVYVRSAFALHALRRSIGDDAFFSLIREWVDRYGGSHATTADFIALAEEVSGKELGEFFQDWLYEVDVPDQPR